MQKGKYETAVMYFLEAGPGKSNYPEPYYQAGICYLKSGELERAKTNFFIAKNFAKDDKLNNDIASALDEVVQKIRQEELVMETEIEKGINIAENESRRNNSFLSDSEKKELRKKLQKEYKTKKETGKPKSPEDYNFSSGIVKITFKRLDFPLAETKSADNPEGILITRVYPPLPVDDHLFVKEGDIIRKIEGVPVIDLDDFSNDKKIQQVFARFNGVTVFRNGQEMELKPAPELKYYLTALFELESNGFSEKTTSYFYEIAKGASEYRDIARIYLVLHQIDYLGEILKNLLNLKSDAETFNLSMELKKLEERASPDAILQPFKEAEKEFNVFIAGLQKFPESPTHLDYLKFSEDIKLVAGRLEKWAVYLETLNAETSNLTTSICTRIRDKKDFLEMQAEFLLKREDYLKQISAWEISDTSTPIAKKIILLDDPFSSRIKTLPFFLGEDKNDILYLINKNKFQDWLGVTKNKIIADSNNLYSQEKIAEISRIMQKDSFGIKETPQFKAVEKIMLEMKTPFAVLSLPEEIRKVNDLFKTAGTEIERMYPRVKAGGLPVEVQSRREMSSSFRFLETKLDSVFALILAVYIKSPYEELTKISNTLYLSASEYLSIANNPESSGAKSEISAPDEPVLSPETVCPLPAPAREPPKVLGLQFGMNDERAQAEFVTEMKELLEEGDDYLVGNTYYMVWNGSLVEVDVPLFTVTFFKTTPPLTDYEPPKQELFSILTGFDVDIGTTESVITRYDNLKENLEKKYGKPVVSRHEIEPVLEVYYEEEDVRKEHPKYRPTGEVYNLHSEWNVQNMTIRLNLKGRVALSEKEDTGKQWKKKKYRPDKGGMLKWIRERVLDFSLGYTYNPLIPTPKDLIDEGSL